MFLDVDEPSSISLGKQQLTFAAGESIHTENSHKYSHSEIVQLAEQSGLAIDTCWLDADELFSLSLLSPA